MSFLTSAQEKVNKIQKQYKSKQFRYNKAFYEYVWYEGLLKVFPDSENLKEGMKILAEYCKENEQ